MEGNALLFIRSSFLCISFCVDSIIRKDLRDFVRYFFDDGITFSKLKGAHFLKTEVIFLGHYVNW